ncbi:MAG: ATP-dependent DNA helicase [Zoogloeaceae bacterium]|nr:ATP-dependent DNA helicase [Zoogloeaceae bacterium]
MNLQDIFSADGPLAKTIAGYRFRPQQIEMAERIEAAIQANQVLVAEAGTGTGKTFAYLAPALLSGGKVIIATGTKTLQDQLFNRDLPAMRDALGIPATIALLKGRANYVCPYHLERAQSEGRFLSREEAGHIRTIARFAKATRTGDKAELAAVPEDSGAWPQATSTRENCLGQDCPHHKACFVIAARREAMEADIVVVNHHLFFADVMLRSDGLGELLPACNTVIFDEAHQLSEVAGLFFGEAVGTAQLIELARDTRLESIAGAKDYLPLPEACRTLEKAAKDFRLAFHREGLRLSEAQWQDHPNGIEALKTLEAELAELTRHLDTQADRSEGLGNCAMRAHDLALRIKRWLHPPVRAAEDEEGDSFIKWAEVTHYSVTLNLTPLSIANIFQRQMEGHPRAWIFTSATLAVGSSFDHYCGELGLKEADTGLWGSPFDYENCAMFYVPPQMPDPNSPFYHEAVLEAAWPVIRAAGGRAFVLCTSLRAMRRIHELLKERLERDKLDCPLMLQGEGSKTELLDRFRFLGNAILVASQSFWEGVDVRGEALSLVVIDKLPFAPPDDPVLSARIEHLKRQGRNAFYEYQLPRAVISMKQGAGRLIRDETDRGVLMVCDPRLVEKPYGKRIWKSLPAMRRTREIGDVEAFFKR